MTSLLDAHERVPGCWSTSSNVAVAARALRGRGHASVLPSVTAAADDVVGTWLADVAHGESVSWMALRAVERELRAHDAPEELCQQSRATALAALRNAAMLESMALRWGVRPRQPKVISIAVRSLEALAAENAGQGCVRETWAALEARYQAMAARDPVIRRAMAQVAADGVRHAEFSWAVDAWACRRLDAEGRGRVAQARAQTVADVLGALSIERDRTLCIEAGLPTAATARGLAHALGEALWSRARAS